MLPAGILLVDKERGWTSHDVVARVRRLGGERRIGHTGTLDPMATGLLVLCTGQATRLVEYIGAHSKRYEGEIQLGIATDTDDAEGAVIRRAPAPALDAAACEPLAARFRGAIEQRPPAFSAIKVAGRRAYAAARRGEDVVLPARSVTVHSLALEPLPEGRLRILVHCGPGTYIRSVARDIGEALGCGAHLAALRRTAVGRFHVEDALTIAEAAELAASGKLTSCMLAPDEGVTELDATITGAGAAGRLAHGEIVDGPRPRRASGGARIYSVAGDFVGIGAVEPDGRVRPLKVFSPA